MASAILKPAPVLTSKQFFYWMEHVRRILGDCVTCVSHMERMTQKDEQTDYFYRKGLGEHLWLMNRFVVITQLAKLYCKTDHQELNIHGLFASLNASVSESWLDVLTRSDTLTTYRLPKWSSMGEMQAFITKQEAEIINRQVVINAIKTARDKDTAHTQVLHGTKFKFTSTLPVFTLSELKDLTDLGVRIFDGMLQGMGKPSDLDIIPTHRLERAIATLYPF
jgi:hypothetical protein